MKTCAYLLRHLQLHLSNWSLRSQDVLSPTDPYCATICVSMLSSGILPCSEVHGEGHDAHVINAPECLAQDVNYMTSLAYCLDEKCVAAGLPPGGIEAFWEKAATRSSGAVRPGWSYREALRNVTSRPTATLGHAGQLNETMLTSAFYNVLYDTNVNLADQSRLMNTFGLTILITGFALPLVLTWLGYLPIFRRLYDKLAPYLVYPALIRNYQVQPLPFLLGNAPTVGQAIYIFTMVLINVVFSVIDYKTTPAHLWFQNQWQQVTGFAMYRTGVLSYAMAPLLILLSGRNNILLWLTNWPHSTFLLLHRWVARLFMLQAVVHSILAVVVYKDMGIYDAQAAMVYWHWGVAATVVGCAMLVLSGLWFRRRAYELFLAGHVVMAVFVLVGCWYHVVYRFPDLNAGFTTWLYAGCAVWFADRVIRIGRMVANGTRRARITDVGDAYVRVDVPGVRWGAAPGRHAYLHFPTLSPLRAWENHPFSLIPTALLEPLPVSSSVVSPDDRSRDVDVEKDTAGATVMASSVSTSPPAEQPTARIHIPEATRTTAGATFFIRKSAGMTASLSSSRSGLLTLIDGPYRNNATSAVLSCDRVLLIAGGIGITGLLPWAATHDNARLVWNARDGTLPAALEGALERLREREVLVGKRVDVDGLLVEEVAAGWRRIGVVVCGPPGLCDDVRAAVARAGRRHRTVFELEVDAYSW